MLKLELKLTDFLLRLGTLTVFNYTHFIWETSFLVGFSIRKICPTATLHAQGIYLQSVSSRADSHAASEHHVRWGGHSGHTNKAQTQRGSSREKGTREPLSQGKGPASRAFQPLPHAACWPATAAFVAVAQHLYNLN